MKLFYSLLLASLLAACAAQDISRIQKELETPKEDRTPVTFSLYAPDADKVTLESTFNYWSQEGEIVLYEEDGTHSVTLYLGDEQWLYRFRVDGKWQHDPANPVRAEAEEGNYNSVLRRDNLIPESIFNANIPHGQVLNEIYRSGLTALAKDYIVYLPPNYSEDKAYPLLFLLHGYGQPPREFTESAQIQNYLDNLIHKGRIKPMVVVMPSGGTSYWRGLSARHVIEELYPLIVETYSVYGTKDKTAIAGGSMGGHGALKLAYENQNVFGLSVPIMMAGPCVNIVCSYSDFERAYPEPFDIELLLYVGSKDNLGFVENYRAFSKYMDDTGQPYELHISNHGGHEQDSHSVRYYRTVLPEILEKVSSFFEGSKK